MRKATIFLVALAFSAISCNQQPARTVTPRSRDARPNQWVYRIDKDTYKIEIDTNGDGRPDVVKPHKDNELVEIESDRNFDGQVDLVQEYSHGILIREVHETILTASNYLLRDRVARMLGPIVTYASGSKKGRLAAPDIEAWFQQDQYQGAPHIVAQWADNHNELAQSWVSADPTHAQYINDWTKAHEAEVADWIKQNPGTPQPKASDLAVMFFENFSKQYPGKFPSNVSTQLPGGKSQTTVALVASGSDVQSIFFDMWRQDHPNADLANVPGDMVTTSGSGLDPHITLQNAQYQLNRVVSKWAADTKRDPGQVHAEIEHMLQSDAFAPLSGLVGEKMVNVLQVNLELTKRYGAPQG
jgi:potassium-transporting ATPase KdpC subunit